MNDEPCIIGTYQVQRMGNNSERNSPTIEKGYFVRKGSQTTYIERHTDVHHLLTDNSLEAFLSIIEEERNLEISPDRTKEFPEKKKLIKYSGLNATEITAVMRKQ